MWIRYLSTLGAVVGIPELADIIEITCSAPVPLTLSCGAPEVLELVCAAPKILEVTVEPVMTPA